MIGIDITTTQNQYRYRGIGVFSKHVLQRFIAHMGEEIVLFGFSSESTISSYGKAEFIDMGKLQEITPLTKFSYSFSLKSLVLAYNEEHKDNPINKFFSPFIHSGVPYDSSWDTYAYVHDMIQKETGVYSSKSLVHNFIKKTQYNQDWKMLSCTKKVMTNSITSQNYIKEYLNIDSVPVYLGIDHTLYNTYYERNLEYISAKYGIVGDYFVYYGGDEKNKNVPFMIKAFEMFSKAHPELNISLVLIGKGFDNEKKLALKNNINNVFFPGLLDDQEKINFMVNSAGFIHFSSIEGFGISVLENLACGVPCLISDIPIYRELFDGCALFADINSVEKTAEKFLDIMNTEKVIPLVSKGIVRSLDFDWDKTFKQIQKVIL